MQQKSYFPDFTKRTLSVLSFLLVFVLTADLHAQNWSPQGRGGQNGGQRNIGRMYGKVVDESGKGVGFASVQLVGMTFDTTTKSMKENLIAGQITEDNGDFSLESLPIVGEFTLKVSFLGYADVEQKVSFGLTRGGDKTQGGQPGGGSRGSWGGGGGMAGNFDKDLGNIQLTTDSELLDEVVVEGEATTVMLSLDKKVFRVDKNGVAAGGTAEDALRNVPSLSVDLDGNLILRNSSPQLFVDGRPTNLELSQISADAIETVEVITNPSAKYDASGGQAGIVNIVLKKDKRIGYNGSVRLGADSQGGTSTGGNINLREGKVNTFLNVNYNRFLSTGVNDTDRENFFGEPLTNVTQRGTRDFQGAFFNTRAGVDYFISNRNTITFEGSYTRGRFKPDSYLNIRTDSLFDTGTTFSESTRNSESNRGFRNAGGSILFKHIFPKQGKEWTADVSYNNIKMDGGGDFVTTFSNSNDVSLERQESDGGSQFVVLQTDFVNPITDKIKIEMGARAAIRRHDNSNASFAYNSDDDIWIRVPNFADEFEYDDEVYAAYGIFSQEFNGWGYQVGLRAESSRYTGVLPESGQTFVNDYPISLFPSAFISKQLNEQDNLQLSYSRRINRPNFFQLMPFTDFSDSLNLRRGNADLLPEFTNSLELTYQNIFKKGHNLLISAYFKQASDLITTFQFTEFNETVGEEVIVTSYANSNSSYAYGAEFTLRNSITKSIDVSTNINLYNSRVDASNVETDLINEQFTWFIKENVNVKLPADFTVQISGQYKSRAAFTPSDGGGHRHWRGITNSAQGYTLDNWFVDFSVRKNILKRKGTLTLSIQDILRTRRSGTYSESDLFIQETYRTRNPQQVRINFMYRFGKPDVTLFKRKNTNMNREGMDMMQ